MKFVCDAPDKKTWFRIETEAEALKESALMDHAVAKYFQREHEMAAQSYKPTSTVSFEISPATAQVFSRSRLPCANPSSM